MDESNVLDNAPAEQQASDQQIAAEAPEKTRITNFSGSHDHSIDSKGRMIIPTSFREALGRTFVCTLSTDNKAIALYPLAKWEAEVEEVRVLMKKNRLAEKLMVHMNKFAYTDCEMDSQGRVLLPAKLRLKILKDERDVCISGSGDYIRVMTQADSNLEDENYNLEIPDPLAFMSVLQQGNQ